MNFCQLWPQSMITGGEHTCENRVQWHGLGLVACFGGSEVILVWGAEQTCQDWGFIKGMPLLLLDID